MLPPGGRNWQIFIRFCSKRLTKRQVDEMIWRQVFDLNVSFSQNAEMIQITSLNGATTLSTTTPSIKTLRLITFSINTPCLVMVSLFTFSITTRIMKIHDNDTHHNDIQHSIAEYNDPQPMEQHILDTNAGKQLCLTATDV
jgi:hypothetical protein